ncbi:MAG: LysE family transporter [Acidimicrobiales bacterium]
MALLLGLLTGLALVAPVGPISIALVGVGVTGGRRPAVRAAGGVALADAVMVTIAFALGSLILTAPERVTDVVEVVLGVVLVAIALSMIGEADRMVETAGRLRRPATALFTATAANPLTLTVWVGVAAAAPYAGDSFSRSLFVGGLITASVVWHTFLALGAAAVGPKIRPSWLAWGSRIAGVLVLGIGVFTMAGPFRG